MAYERIESSIRMIESQREIEISQRVFEHRIDQAEFEDVTLRNLFLDEWAAHTKEILGSSSGIYRFTTSYNIVYPFKHI